MTPVQRVARMVFLPSWMIAAVILVKSYAAVGDGFAAGSLASVGVIAFQVTHGRAATRVALPVRWIIFLAPFGLVVMMATAAVPLLFGAEAVLTHFPRPGEHVHGLGLLKLHTAFLFDAAMACATLGAITAVADALAARDAEELR